MAKRWTERELQYLSDNLGYMNHKQMASKLGKTVWAIKLKQCRFGLRFIDNVYTCTMLSKELGRSRSRIRIWVDRGWLKGSRAEWTWYYGKRPIIFKEKDIVSFLKEHCDLFSNNGIPNLYFKNVVQRTFHA